jgi:TetR/AcrR family transcriptional repressor of nem operon
MRKNAVVPVRERLLQAGVLVFSKSGFNGSSVQDVTEAAGVPKGSFYNHFESKEALGAAVVEYFWENKARHALAILDQDTLEPLVRLRRYFEQVIQNIEGMGYTCGCFIGNMTAELSDHSAVISDQLSAAYARWTRHIADCIALAQQAGSIHSKADPDILATFALNAWEGALLRARVAKSSRPLQQFIDTLFTQLLG